MIIRLKDSKIQFNSKNVNVLIKESDSQYADATLMNSAEKNESLFNFTNDENNSYMSHEIRVKVFNYDVKFLKHNEISDFVIEFCTYWIIDYSLIMLRDVVINYVKSAQSFTSQSFH